MIPYGKGLREYDAALVSIETGLDTGRETLVQQHLKEEVDVNTIVRRFGLVSALPAWSREGLYGDFTDIVDFDSALARISRTQDAFLKLPAEVRDRFKNDPGELVRYAQSVSEEEFVAAMRPREAAVPPAEPSGSGVGGESSGKPT